MSYGTPADLTVSNRWERERHGYGVLTTRELQMLQDVMDGLTAVESGAKRHCSPATVKTHRSAILRRMRARSMPHAVALYLKGDRP